MARHVGRCLVVGLLVLVTAAMASAQGMYYQEVEKDGKIYVFNLASEYARWSAGEPFKGDVRLKYGPKGEDVYFDTPAAIMLYNFKHGLPAEALIPPPPPPPPPPAWRISGYMFGDYYYFGNDHDARYRNQQGFWFRRIYLTYDHNLSSKFTTRLRFEVNSTGNLTSAANTPYIKDAYLRWTYKGNQQVWFGIFPTPTFELIEGFWGLRHIEKTPADLYRTDSSRDFGFGLQGSLNQSQSVRYSYQFGNESSTNAEIDKNKANRFSVSYAKPTGFAVEGFYGHFARDGDTDRSIYQIFAGYRQPKFRGAFQYYRNTRNVANGNDLELDLYSVFGVFDIVPRKWTVFARVDRFDDPNPDGAGIAYLPIDPRAAYTFFLGGVEFYLLPSVRFSPNVETVSYGKLPDGTSLKTDVLYRATMYWTW
jgi:Phosphate-selective porin O and P